MHFKINHIRFDFVGKRSFAINIEFENGDLEPDFGTLSAYYKAIHVYDKDLLEEYDRENAVYDRYDLGLTKIGYVEGADTIIKVQNKKDAYCYSQYLIDCYITRSVILQIAEMKEHLESGFCRWGDYPEQVGAFATGDTYTDFIRALECLDKFWD